MIALSTLPSLSGCRAATRSRVDGGPGPVREAIPIGADQLSILHAASLAPSSHNTQPWLVTVAERNRWIIGQDPARAIPAVDPGNREPVISIGAFLENLVLAAEETGYHADLEVRATTLVAPEIARVILRSTAPEVRNTDVIRRRRTIKNHYRTRELDRNDRARLTEGIAGRVTYFPPGSRQSAHLAEGTIEAFRQQSYRDEAQEELAAWIRFSNGEAKEHRDGLTTAGMEITGFGGLVVRTFYDRDSVMKESFRERGIDGLAQQARSHGGWFVVTSPDGSVGAHLDAGRHFQRLALRACERSIAVHPMSQLVQEEPWRHSLADDLGVDGQVRLVVRTGYVDRYPEPVSLRRPVSWFTRPA